MPTPPNEEFDAADANRIKDQARYATHAIFIRQAERVDIAMASGKDPYPAFTAWSSALLEWALDDATFLDEAHALDTLLEEVYHEYGAIPRLEYVRAWRPLYFGVMRRARMFPHLDMPPAITGSSNLDRMGRRDDPSAPRMEQESRELGDGQA